MTIASGSESQVNSTATGNQTAPTVIALAGGGYVVVWDTPAGWSLQAFDEDGATSGSEVTYTSPTPAVWAAMPDGRLAYAYHTSPMSTAYFGILNGDGSQSVATTNFLTSLYSGVPVTLALAVNPAGDILLAASSTMAVMGFRIGTDGQRIGGSITIASADSAHQHQGATNVRLAIAPNGDFLAIYDRAGADAQARYLASDGTFGPEFDLFVPDGAKVTHGSGELYFAWIEEDSNGNPNVAVGTTDGTSFDAWWTGGAGTDPSDVNLWQLADGRLLVTWTASSGGDGDGKSVMGQLVADGVPIGDAFVINSDTAGDQSGVSIAALDDGRFVATWQTPDADGFGIASRTFDPKSLAGTDSNDLLVGGAFGDTIIAGDGGDTLDGDGGDDSIDAGAGDDVIYGSAGDDTVDGGDGDDAYLVGGTSADWTFERDLNGNILVQWADDPSYGTKTLIDVETFRFGDDSELSLLDGPIANPDLIAATEDATATISIASLLANDWDAGGLGLSFVSAQGAQHGSVSVASGNITFTPTANYNGPASFTYTVKNAAGVESTGTVTLNIAAVNDNPTTASDALAGYQGIPRTYAAAELVGNDTDIDGDTLAITVVSNAAHGTAVLNSNGTVTFTPDANFAGTGASFRYTVGDGHGGTAMGTANVFVDVPNRAPVANDDNFSIEGTSYLPISLAQLLANDTDLDGDALTIVNVTSGVGGTVHYFAGYDDTVRFSADSGFTGVASFTYQVSDGTTTSEAATVRINVSAFPPPIPLEPPVIRPFVLTISGTSRSDRMDRTSLSEDIRGRGGHDTIKAAGGDDRLRGEVGNDKLYGESGRDTLVGGAGKDSLNGGGHADVFVFNLKPSKSNADTITDFKHNTDIIALDDTIFAAIGPTLDAGEFFAKRGAVKAHDADDRIVYNKSNGRLYYDDDGKGGHAAVHFATLSTKPTLDHGDFAIV